MERINNLSKYKNRRRELRRTSTRAEILLWEKLRAKRLNNIKFRRQQGFKHYIVDFCSIEFSLVIEIDGDVHFTQDAVEYDKLRTQYLNSIGLKVIRFKNNEIINNIDFVLEKILENIFLA